MTAAKRDAQAVLRRLQSGEADTAAAMEAHLARYYVDEPEAARAEIREVIRNDIRNIELIEDLVYQFESFEITLDYALQWYINALQSGELNAPRPPSTTPGCCAARQSGR